MHQVPSGTLGSEFDPLQEHNEIVRFNATSADTVPQVLALRGGQAMPLDSRHSGVEQIAGYLVPQAISLSGIGGFLKPLYTVVKLAQVQAGQYFDEPAGEGMIHHAGELA